MGTKWILTKFSLMSWQSRLPKFNPLSVSIGAAQMVFEQPPWAQSSSMDVKLASVFPLALNYSDRRMILNT